MIHSRCHPEQREGSRPNSVEILRHFVPQNDTEMASLLDESPNRFERLERTPAKAAD